MDDYNLLFKVVLIGNSGVGKTSMVNQFTQNFFALGHNTTIGVDLMIKTIHVDKDNIVKLQIWDTAGQERFRAITTSYYRSADAILLVYDVSCSESFDSLPGWMEEIDKYSRPSSVVYVVGNKSDLATEREVSSLSGEEFAGRRSLKFLETSAKTSDNIEGLFREIASTLAAQAIQDKLRRSRDEASTGVSISTPTQSSLIPLKGNFCCGGGSKESNHL